MYILKKLRNSYVIRQVKNIKFPKFYSEHIIREKIIFIGKVQKVGFRLEIYLLAKRLNLSGWVKNNNDKSVEAEIQGPSDKITFIIEFMKSLKRASVKEVVVTELEIKTNEKGFVLESD